MCDTVIAEGAAHTRDGKKWKSRWLVVRKPSPVADCLVLHVYKERGVKERSSVTLEHICGLEASVCGDGVSFTLSILSLTQTAVLGFDSREALQSWDLRLRYCLGEVHSFSVSVLSGTKLESGPATLHVCNDLMVIARDQRIIGRWKLLELRRFGPVNGGFVFEGGTRCGFWAGVFCLSCAEGEHISFLFDCILRGISPSRGPFGLKPLLPECSVSAASVQDRLNTEAEQLEQRLSLLSHSTASSSSVGSSVAGEACSIGSSDTSDTSQSDCGISNRSALWTESVLSGSAETSHSLAPRTASEGEEHLSESSSDGLRVPADPLRSRKLKETGRQNSSDSGIATGSHSSYTGSFSSYSGSLDAANPGEEYGTLLNLPTPADPEKHLCRCPRCPTHQYQVPSSVRYLYDTPRSLLEIPRDKSRSKDHTRLTDSGQTELSVRMQSTDCSQLPSQSDSALIHTHRTEETLKLNRGEGRTKGEGLTKGEGPHESCCGKTCCDCAVCSPLTAGPKSLFTTCSTCGGLKATPLPQSGLTSLPTVTGEQSAPPTCDVTGQPTNQELEEIRKPCVPFHNPWKRSSERRLDSYVSCLSDLLAHYCPTDQRSVNSNVYEPMSWSVVSVGLESRRPARSAHTLLYENCLHCRRGESSCHLPKATPPARDAFLQSQECFLQKQSKELRRNHSNISESLSFSAEHLSISLQQIPEEDKSERAEKGRANPAYEVMESRATERNSESEEKSRYECMRSCEDSHHLTEGGPFVFPVDSLSRGDPVTYVNIPISPVSKKQLHYLDLEMQEPSGHIRGKSSSKYAQIDITATEAAHRAGTQHALGREEGLQRLEQRRRGGVPQ